MEAESPETVVWMNAGEQRRTRCLINQSGQLPQGACPMGEAIAR